MPVLPVSAVTRTLSRSSGDPACAIIVRITSSVVSAVFEISADLIFRFFSSSRI